MVVGSNHTMDNDFHLLIFACFAFVVALLSQCKWIQAWHSSEVMCAYRDSVVK